MKRFTCSCGNEVFFDNTYCSQCGAELGFDIDKLDLITLSDDDIHRKCEHRTEQLQCNWLTETDNKQCLSCSLTRTIPTLEKLENWRRWYKLEVAKRRLIYGLLSLHLPVEGLHTGVENGLVFDFLEDKRTNPLVSLPHVYIGHARGVITINAAEADSSFREATREAMNEPYRTLLGHYRHEVGHYYWDKLIRNSHQYQYFKELFGDDTLDYRSTMDAYYEKGPNTDWQENYISAYASSHPLEDWAETWAHYLLIIETLETALSFNLITKLDEEQQFDSLMNEWMQLVVVLNALNRSTGSKDAYPFIISEPVKEKLSFIHDVIRQ
jgi:hypothetical protein